MIVFFVLSKVKLNSYSHQFYKDNLNKEYDFKKRKVLQKYNEIAEEYFKRGNNIAFRGVDFHNLTKNEIGKILNKEFQILQLQKNVLQMYRKKRKIGENRINNTIFNITVASGRVIMS